MEYYCIVYKPFNVLTQFSALDGRETLKTFFDVPGDVYPIGRLDADSEGLLLLSNDKKLNHLLLDPIYEHERESWVQVDGAISSEAIWQLEKGVAINSNGARYHTKKCRAILFDTIPDLPERIPPVRFRKNIPTSWIRLILKEGKNRQVRKMTAAVGFPTLRLVRYRIGKCTLDGLQPGDMRVFSKTEIYQQVLK